MGKGWRALGALAAAACVAAGASQALAQEEPITAKVLADRAEIADLITRYYWDLGHAGSESMSSFYTEDAELVLGGKSYRGKEGIESAYGGGPKPAGQAAPAENRGGGPQRGSYSFNVLLSNELIVVHGETATAKLIFTEVVQDTRSSPPRLLTQGREFDNLVKVAGHWRLKRRQITGAADTPEGWTP